MTAWVRSGVLVGAPELIAELGGDPQALANDAGIERVALADPDFPVEVTSVVRFLELAAEACRCETFGLRLSKKQELSLFGPLWPLFQNVPTLGALAQAVVDYFPMHTQGALVALEPEPEGASLVYDVAAEVGGSRRQIIELGFGIMVAELQRWARDWRPSDVAFRHGPPLDLRLHRQILGPEVRFNADRNALFIEAWMLSQPNPARDAALHASLLEDLEPRRRALPGALRLQAEIAVRALLPFADCTLDIVARLLGTSRRTLQRRLAEDGISFEALIDKVRADLALTYLRDSMLSVTAIAEILQFSETSALSRAVRRWYGAPPTAIRKGPA
ncbi:AraC family transcriptional regulator [Phenylobacterium montanum]|uniref:AraC family transcriptional regulator n=1 Tax=Phenylobacterium montanum TaxID=2823693 RepID=A0A975IWK6_9CAUL|nr:AraC family transcriptional regulator [Caulobacter sp. S6]QUD89684.1 AraC family transcriptional regulator [Caulobacter sp. S6]